MIEYMLDTDTCIYVIKNKPESVLGLFNQHYDVLAISSVVASELHYGAAKSQVPRHLQEVALFLDRIQVLPFDDYAAQLTGEIRANLARQGTPIGPYDVMIAGHAMAIDCTLVTNNTREFSRVDPLSLVNWTKM